MPHINEFSGNSEMKVPIPDSPLGFVKLFLTRELLDFLHQRQIDMLNKDVEKIQTLIKAGLKQLLVI